MHALGQKLPLLGLDHLCCSSAECSLPSQASCVLGVSGWVEASGRTRHSVSHVIVSEDAPWSQGAMGDMDFRNHRDWIPILLSAHLPNIITLTMNHFSFLTTGTSSVSLHIGSLCLEFSLVSFLPGVSLLYLQVSVKHYLRPFLIRYSG